MGTTPSVKADYSQFCACMDLIVAKGTASAVLLSNKLSIAPALAEHLIQIYENNGLIGPDRGDGTHAVLLSPDYWTSLRPQFENKNSTPAAPHTPPQPEKVDYPSDLTIEQLDCMDGHDFEYTCADLLIANGFSRVRVTKASGDFGIDILAEKDGEKYAIQCKCYSRPIGNHAVEEAYSGAAYYNGRVPVVMSNQTFTVAAQHMADRIGVLLWGRKKVKHMLLAYESDEQRRLRKLKRIACIIGYILAVIACILVFLFFGSVALSTGSVFILLYIPFILLRVFMPHRRRRRRRRRRW